MADECYEVEVNDALIRGLAGILYVIYLFFDIDIKVYLLGGVVGKDCGQGPIQLIPEVILHPFRV